MTVMVCSACSRVIAFNGQVPENCPKCGATLDHSAEVTNALDPSAAPAQPASRRLPAQIGRYAIVSLLGTGGCSTVYLARDTRLDRLVALKVPDAVTKHNPAAAERFAREARTAAQLRHPGIVSIFNVEEDEDLVFIVSEYVEGEPLNSHLKKSRLSFRGVASLMAAVASAVEYAHSKGIIHRDIKPGNIMIDAAGNPRLMDFGLAKQLERDATVTIQEQVLGTPVYMSPEQARGNPAEVDSRTDVYSLGATLYHLLTNEVPFYGESGMVRDKVLHEEPTRPRLVDRQIPADLETICLKAMEKDPGQRYPKAGDLADDLERWLRGEPIVARHIGSFERSWRWCRRNPAPAGMIASVIALLLVVAIGSSIIASLAAKGREQEAEKWRQEAKAKEAETAARQTAEKAKIDAEEALARDHELLSRGYVEKGSRYLRAAEDSDDYNPIKALPWFYEALKLDAKNPTRLVADRIRVQTLLDFTPRVERMWFSPGDVRDAQMTPRGDKFFVLGVDGTVRICRTATDGPPVVLPAGLLAIEVAAFSHDGKWLATGSQDGVRIWEADSGNLVKGPLASRQTLPDSRALPSAMHLREIAFGNSGRLLAAVSLEGVSQVWNIETGKPQGPAVLLAAALVGFADSEQLLVLRGKNDRAIHAYAVQTGSEKYVLGGKREAYWAATVDPNGERISGCIATGELDLYKAAGGELIKRFPASAKSVRPTASTFSPDGRLFAAGSIDGKVSVWDVDGRQLLWGHPVLSGPIDRLEFSPDGASLAVINLTRRLRVVAAESGDSIAPSIGTASPIRLARWTDVSGRIAIVGANGVARLWNLEQSIPACKLPCRHEIRLATISAYRRVLAAAEGSAAIYVLKFSDDERLDVQSARTLKFGDRNFDAIALTNDGSRLAVATRQQVSIWETKNQRQVGGPLLHSEVVSQIRFTPNGALLVTVSAEGHAAVWDVATKRRLYQPLNVGENSTDLDIDRDGKHCAVASPKGVTIWELASGERVRPGFVVSGLSRFARFLNERQTALIAQRHRPTQILDIATGQSRRAIAKRGEVQCIEVSDDKSLFFTGFGDHTARLWKADDASPASPSFESPSVVHSVCLDPGRRCLVTLTEDSQLVFWDARTAELIASVSVRCLGSTLSERARLKYPSRVPPLVTFSPGNRSLYAIGSGGLVVRFRLELDTGAYNDLEQEIALRSGEQPDGAGGLKLLEPEELIERWRSRGRKVPVSQSASLSFERFDRQEAKAAFSNSQVPVQ